MISLFQHTEHYSLLRYAIEAAVYLLGSFAAFILPGWLWVSALSKKNCDGVELAAVSFVISISFLIAATTVLKILLPRGIEAGDFLFILAVLMSGGIAACFARKVSLRQYMKSPVRYASLLAVLVLCAVMIGWIFQDKILWVPYEHDFSPEHVLGIPLGMQSDVLENFGLTHSLKTHLLPYWDLEYADRFGYTIVDPPLSSFFSFFLFLLFGDAFAVQSMGILLVVVATFFLCAKFVTVKTEGAPPFYLMFIFPIVLCSYVLVFFSHPEASVAIIDHIHWMTLFVLLQYYFIVQENERWFLVFAVLAFLTKFEAAFFTIGGLVVYQLVFAPRLNMAVRLGGQYLRLICPYILLMFMIGAVRGDLGVYLESFFVERFIRLDYWHLLDRVFPDGSTLPWNMFSWGATGEFIRQFLIGSALLGLSIFFPQKDKTSRFLSLTAVGYFIFVLLSREKRVHYISPLVFMAAIIGVRVWLTENGQGIIRSWMCFFIGKKQTKRGT